MTDLQAALAALPRLKIFPLPTAVLLPGAALSLHIFEPRYRQLVSDALATDRVLAMGMLEPGWEPHYQERPPMRRICGVGRIAQDERLPDGRYNIQLVGLMRAEILEELHADLLYREVRARSAPERPAAKLGRVESLRQALLTLCAAIQGEAAEALARAAAPAKDGGALADRCAAALISEAVRRQEVLEALDVDRRVELILEVVGELLLQLKRPPPRGGMH